ncbi:hypothetical protein BHF71_09100 [Vulcanibacillus modesticaldus]|uniref:Probable membrane transporter protein n=1 Tax=Vulcanibacillus modesticaldus TaxID=337097 RepID=A0A1D2YUS0_9BACI|nr:sulfite exporter TauE/SafE family protein [Vulcanibacillus modesticaldus]OEF99458.1 hypothetical protein BHF71_09100 [Vulcanibacillus modesticaldus]
MLIFLSFTGLLVGILSGMLGIGGGILITPLLLYVPPLLGLPTLSMKAITGLTMVQGLAGSASGFVAHRRYHIINNRLIYWMGPVIVVTSFAGAHFSGFISDEVLMAIFAMMALIAALLMFISKKEKPLTMDAKEITFNRPLAVTIAATVGLLGGLVGQGGSFMIIPLLINVLGIPTKVALGSNLGIVLLSSIAGLSGKISSGLIEPLSALYLVVGVIIGSQLGGFLSHRLRNNTLKRILAAVIGLVSLRIWWTLLKPLVVSLVNSLPANIIILYTISIISLILWTVNTCLFVWLYLHFRRKKWVVTPPEISRTHKKSLS